MIAALLVSAAGILLDLSESWLARGADRPATLVMFSAPGCDACDMLVPHLEAMQTRLNSDGVALVVGVLDADRYSRVAEELSVSSYPSFAYYPAATADEAAHDRHRAPSLFGGGTQMSDLVRWLILTHVEYGGRPPQQTQRAPLDARLHPGATMLPGATSLAHSVPRARAPPPPPLRAVPPAPDCTDPRAAVLGAVGGELAGPWPDEAALRADADAERYAVASWDVSSRRFLPLAAPLAAAAATAAAGESDDDGALSPPLRRPPPPQRSGALAGNANVLARNRTSCLFAAGTLRPSAAARMGYEGAEELLAVWAPRSGPHGHGAWMALHGPLRRAAGASASDGGGGGALYAARGGLAHALCVHGSRLFVGGGFSLREVAAEGREGGAAPASPPDAHFLAVWHADAAEWALLGRGVDGIVLGLAVDEARGRVYVCGGFSRAGQLHAPSGLAVWDGAAWHVPPRAPSGTASLTQVVVGGGLLYARSDDGRVHVLGDDDAVPAGKWTTLPVLPPPLRSASTLLWLPRPLVEYGPAEGDADAQTAAEGAQQAASGSLLAGGDFLFQSAGAMGGVAVWSGGAWHRLDEAEEARPSRASHRRAGGSAAAAASADGSVVRWGALTGLGVGVPPWEQHPPPPPLQQQQQHEELQQQFEVKEQQQRLDGRPRLRLMATGRFGDGAGLAIWQGQGRWERVSGTAGAVRALSIATESAEHTLPTEGDAEAAQSRGPALLLRSPEEPAPRVAELDTRQPTWVELTPSAHGVAAGAASARWESGAARDELRPDAPSGQLPGTKPLVGDAATSPFRSLSQDERSREYQRRRRQRQDPANDALLLGTLILLPLLYLAYHTVQPEARAANALLRETASMSAPARAAPPALPGRRSPWARMLQVFRL